MAGGLKQLKYLEREHRLRRLRVIGAIACAVAFAASPRATLTADKPVSSIDLVTAAQSEQIKVIARVSPSAVCIYNSMQRGGGSGVLIDPDGYGLTNYHVVAGMLDTRKGFGGLADGVLYDLEVLGIDVTGDVAMFRLMPPKPGFQFPHATLGDSDTVRIGDTAIAIGNPFSLSEDYTPSVSVGIVTGVHRYQWGVHGNLVYTDCIQVDTAINPGNSGGPLFNINGEVIGINGRISVNTRGRFNVGFGYAISSNQIMRFMPALRAGALARHGTLLAVVEDDLSAGGTAFRSGSVRFTEVQEGGPADSAGVQSDDTLLSFDGVAIETANQMTSILGTYPANWPVPLVLERHGRQRTVVVRLEAVEPKLHGSFDVDRETNARAVRRVLESFQRVVFMGADAGRPTRFSWTADRSYGGSKEELSRPTERFRVTYREGAMGQMRRMDANGTSERIIEFDDNEAKQRTGGAEDLILRRGERDILSTLFVLYNTLLLPVDEIDFSPAVHVGGDAIIGLPENLAALPAEQLQSRRTRANIVEVIYWLLPNGAEVRFSFDAKSFLLLRAEIEDDLTESNASILFSDYEDVDYIRWPSTLHIKSPTLNYREKLSDWELTR